MDTSSTVSEGASSAPPSLTPREAAERLDVSDGTIRRWLADGSLDGVRVGGRLRVRQEAVDAIVRPAHRPEEHA